MIFSKRQHQSEGGKRTCSCIGRTSEIWFELFASRHVRPPGKSGRLERYFHDVARLLRAVLGSRNRRAIVPWCYALVQNLRGRRTADAAINCALGGRRENRVSRVGR